VTSRDWIRLAERKEKEAKKLLLEAQAFRLMARETTRTGDLVGHNETIDGLNSLTIRPSSVTRPESK
jgi:hypothetical protein